MTAACRGSLRRMGVGRAAVGQLHWSAANYAPFQERALWDGLIRMYDEVRASGLVVHQSADMYEESIREGSL